MSMPKGFKIHKNNPDNLPAVNGPPNNITPYKPFSAYVKEHTVIRHSYRLLFIVGNIMILPLILASAWLLMAGWEHQLGITLLLLSFLAIFDLFVIALNKDTINQWTNQADYDKNNKRSRY